MQKLKNIWHLINAITANIFFLFPTRKLIVIGVTGTDGKTTTASAINHILKLANQKTAIISTVGAEVDGMFVETGLHVTTPGPFAIQKFAKSAVQKKCKYLILEATSIGLDQYRDFGIRYEIGIITNLSHEHLDYHGSMHNYALAKFKLLKRSRTKLVTPDIEEISDMSKSMSGLNTYSFSKKADFDSKSFNIPISFGDYNKENLIGASSACLILGIEKNIINKALITFQLPSGRMEKIPDINKRLFFVDFGHTPNALESALSSIKQTYPNKKIIAVFGAAGLSGYSKRPMMGKAASCYCDKIIITSEDPRTEPQTKIAAEIIHGFILKFNKKDDLFIINDRQKAINKAVELSNLNTICVFFGKGHEKSLNIDGIEYPWDEKKAVVKALK